MANQAQKKREARAKKARIYLGLCMVVVNVVFFAYHYLWSEEEWDYAFGKVVAIHTGLSLFLSRGIVNSELNGLSTSTYFDTFVLNLVVQMGSLYSEKAWYLFLLIPAVLFYKLIRFIPSMLGGSKAE